MLAFLSEFEIWLVSHIASKTFHYIAGENGEVWRYTDLKMILGNQSTAVLT